MMKQLDLGQSVKKKKAGPQNDLEETVFSIVNEYEKYALDGEILSYLRNVGYYIHL